MPAYPRPLLVIRSNLSLQVGWWSPDIHRGLSTRVMNLNACGFVGLPKRTLGIGPLKAERMADPEMCGIKEAGVLTLSESGLEVVERRKLQEGRGRETAGVIQAVGLGKRETRTFNVEFGSVIGVRNSGGDPNP